MSGHDTQVLRAEGPPVCQHLPCSPPQTPPSQPKPKPNQDHTWQVTGSALRATPAPHRLGLAATPKQRQPSCASTNHGAVMTAPHNTAAPCQSPARFPIAPPVEVSIPRRHKKAHLRHTHPSFRPTCGHRSPHDTHSITSPHAPRILRPESLNPEPQP